MQQLGNTLDQQIYGPDMKKVGHQGDIVRMISAYEIKDVAVIKRIEALLIRATPNDHRNKNLPSIKYCALRLDLWKVRKD